MIRGVSARAAGRRPPVLLAVALLAAGLSTGTAAGTRAAPLDSAVGPAGVRVTIDPVVTGLPRLVQVVAAPDGTRRLFVVEKQGVVRVVSHGQLRSRPYLDISNRVTTADNEQGLLSIAFAPDFRQRPVLFAAYTRVSDGSIQVSRFRVASPTARHVRASAERHVLLVPHTEAGNHNGGQLMFGKRRLLFISTGDGGVENDGNHNAEQLGDLKAKLLRIDALHSCGTRRYCVPATNPFPHARNHNKRLVFDWGLRNPWRASIDRKTGDLWIGDVGQGSWEEIDHTHQVGGKDFGWSCREGTHSFITANCTIGGVPRHMTDPVHEYAHTNGRCAVIGGFVYRGPRFPFAHGIYLYADYCGGQVYGLEHTSTGWHNARIGSVGSPTGFGLADNGELYVVTDGGSLARVVFHRR